MQFNRTINLIGEENLNKIKNANILVLGVGGVGSFAVEGLIRCGVQNITIIDGDVVDITNLNRQLIALHSTIGKPKVLVMKERILDINPNAKVTALNIFLTKDNLAEINLSNYDFILDLIDNITVKIELATRCDQLGINLISCMGTGNKLCPEEFVIDDIYNTSICPLARVTRKELKARGVKKLTVLYSKEEPKNKQNRTPSSISFTPSIAGLRICEYVIKKLTVL